MTHRLWSCESNNDCLLTEGQRIQEFLTTRDWMSQLVFRVCRNPEGVALMLLKE